MKKHSNQSNCWWFLLVVLILGASSSEVYGDEPQSVSVKKDTEHPGIAISAVKEPLPQKEIPSDEMISGNQALTSLDPEISADENPLPESLSTAHFPQRLIEHGPWKLSSHESLTFTRDKVETEANGNHVTFDLKDLSLKSVTFVGYVLGPFTPFNDYLDVYFDTVDSIRSLVGRAKAEEDQKSTKDQTLTDGLEQAANLLIEIRKQAVTLKARAQEEEEYLKLMAAIRDYLKGEMPAYDSLTFSKTKNERGTEVWQGKMKMESSPSGQAISIRNFTFQKAKEEYVVLGVVDYNAENHLVAEEHFDYDTSYELRKYQMKAFYQDGHVMRDKETRFDSGVPQSRYLEEFSLAGSRTRFVREIFYDNGMLKSTTDFDYLKSKKYIYEFDLQGKAVNSKVETLQGI